MILVAKRYRTDTGALVAIDEVREEAARCCDETAKMERGERGALGTPGVDGRGGEFTDAAFGVACEVALIVGGAIRSTGRRARPDFCWSTAAVMLRTGWNRGQKLVPMDLTKSGRPSA